MPEVMLHRYRAEVDHDGSAVPPRQYKLKPLSSKQELEGAELSSEPAEASKGAPMYPRRSVDTIISPRATPPPCSPPAGTAPPLAVEASPNSEVAPAAQEAAGASAPAAPGASAPEAAGAAAPEAVGAAAPEAVEVAALAPQAVAAPKLPAEGSCAAEPEAAPAPARPAPSAAVEPAPAADAAEAARPGKVPERPASRGKPASPSQPATSPAGSLAPRPPLSPKCEAKSALKSPKACRSILKSSITVPEMSHPHEEEQATAERPRLKSALKRGMSSEVHVPQVQSSSSSSSSKAPGGLLPQSGLDQAASTKTSIFKKSCLKKSSTHPATFMHAPVPEGRPLENKEGTISLSSLSPDELARHSERQGGTAITRASSKCSSAVSEYYCPEDDEVTVGFSEEQEDLMQPLSLSEERPEMWTGAGLCKRAYFRAAQKYGGGLPKAKFATEPSIMQIPSCGSGLPLHLQERLQGSSLGRRVSMREQAVVLDGAVVIGVGGAPAGPSESSCSKGPNLGNRNKLQRSTSILICVEGDDFKGRREARSLAEAGGTGADKDLHGADSSDAPADTGGTPPQHCVNPLREVLTAKKVNIKQVREVLQNLPDVEHWVNTDLDGGPSALPPPLFFAVGATLPQVVALLLEFSADVKRRFKGPKVYNGWIKPDATPIEAVENRKGRFVGTMLGDRLEEMLGLMKMAEGKEEQQVKKKRLSKKLDAMLSEELAGGHLRQRKSILLPGAHGNVQHTQGHPSLQYEVRDKLGEGALSTVHLAVHRQSNERRALKAEMKFEEWVIWDEIAIMRKLSHPNVIRLFETFEDNTNIFVVLEACTGGELFNRLATEGGVPENHAARMMQQLASSVKYIHNQKICHRDIQPENFLLQDDGPLESATVKLIDFTTAKEFGPNSLLKTKICTLHYVAPEILSKKELPYTEKVDVWSLGIVFFVILCGVPPFFGDNEVAVLKKIKKGSFKFNPPEVWSNISKEAKDLVQEMLVVDVENRYSADDVTNHPWLSRDFKEKQSKQNHLSSEQLNSLRNFHARNRVQKVVQRLRAHDLSNAAIDELRDIFQRLDTDSSGEVHISSIRDKIRRIPALNENLEEIMRVLWSLEHGSGKVNFDDFLKALVARQNAVQKEACRAIFDVFDFDGNGTMSQEELKMALGLGAPGNGSHDSFKAGVETVFGMAVDEVEARFTEYLDKEEYSFDKFFDMMKRGCTNR